MLMEGKQAPVYCRGAVCGAAELKREGLYWLLDCRCRTVETGILRLYAAWSGEPFCCGVLQPDAEGLCLRRRFAASSFPAEEITGFTASERAEEIWQPWEGRILDVTVSGAVSCRADGKQMAAISLGRDGSFPFMQIFCLGRPIKIGGVWHLAWEIPDDGTCGEVTAGV